jgi:hypothetical protein
MLNLVLAYLVSPPPINELFLYDLHELGEDRLAKRIAIASALSVALGVFTVGAILGGKILGALIG